jgi:polyphosphate kinase
MLPTPIFGSWYVVPSDGRKRTGIDMIEHPLANIPYKKLPRDKIALPKRLKSGDYREPDYWLKAIYE